MPRASSYERILDAAEKVVIETGASHMTLSAVAKKAHISKGGVIYNFPTKDDLLKAMVKRLAQKFRHGREKYLATLKGEPFAELKAHILFILNPDPKLDRIRASLLVAISHNPEFVKCIQEEYKLFIEELPTDILSLPKLMPMILAADGLKLLELLKISPFTPEQRQAIIQEIFNNIHK